MRSRFLDRTQRRDLGLAYVSVRYRRRSAPRRADRRAAPRLWASAPAGLRATPRTACRLPRRVLLASRRLFLFHGRLLAMRPAYFFMQIRRSGFDRRKQLDRSKRRREPRQAILGKAGFQQFRRLHRARRRRRRAKHDGDQPLAVAGGGGNDVVSGRADETGLHAVDAWIAPDQRVGVAHHAPAEFDRRDVPVGIVLGKIVNECAREDGEIARRGDLAVGRQAVGIDEIQFGHAERMRGAGHVVGEIFDRAVDAFGEHDRHVVG